MRKKLTLILASILGAGSLGAAPVIPAGEMEWKYAYQYNPTEIDLTSPTSTTPTQKKLKDKDGNNLISVAVFEDSYGNLHEIEIDDTRYARMGEKGGYGHNPTKKEYKSLLKSLAKPVDAAIAFDDSSQGNSVGAASSLTYSHTVSGSDRLLIVGVWFGSSRSLSSITYNGDTMSDVVTILDTGGGERHGMQYLIAPDTGSNNVVVTLSGSAGIESTVASYTGVDQTDAIDATRTELGLETGTTYSEAITSVEDNTWAIWSTREYAGRTISAGADTALRERIAVNFGLILADSDAAITPAGSRTLNLSASLSGNWFSDILVTIIPAAAAGGGATEDVIWFF